MVLVLAIGDLHIPQRAVDLPAKFKKLLVPGKMHKVLATGNLCSQDTLDYLRTISADVTAVSGDFDDVGLVTQLSAVVEVGSIRIGLVHGHSVLPASWADRLALSAVARELDVDVLISGHTHAFDAFEAEGRFYLNPGSATGAFSAVRTPDVIPSFALLDVQGNTVVVYVYKLIDGDVKVEKLEFTKKV
ncbi:vacuolar sorting protein vps29 [Obelidium mucronatum]|nr:vacuolar sorting protein vps29 [Obelidium mucronatum]